MNNAFPRRLPHSWRSWSSLVVCLLLSLVTLTGCREAPRQRKNVKDLTAQEKKDFVEAVLKLKATPSPFDNQSLPSGKRLSWYDQFVIFHKQVTRASTSEHVTGHHNPTFLPWHRKMLMLYEDALREVSGKDITLPYWDWTDPASTSALLGEDFMGPGGVKEQDYAVMSGPFRKGEWELNILPDDATNYERSVGKKPGEAGGVVWLVRALGVDSGNVDQYHQKLYSFRLPNTADVERCMSAPLFDLAPWGMNVPSDQSFRNCLEGFSGNKDDPTQNMHNIGHDWVAGQWLVQDGDTVRIRCGTMEPLETSPNDPIFFLHHVNVDRLWAQWEETHPNAYEPTSGGQVGWHPEDTMYPFNQYASNPKMKAHGLTVESMLGIKALNYEYK